MKTCTQCGVEKHLADFHRQRKHKTGHRPECKVCCNTRNQRYYVANKAQILAKTHVFNRTEHRRKYVRDFQRARERKLRDGGAAYPRTSACEICGQAGRVVFDHDHTSGQFRGWLCDRCNRALGLLKDSAGVLRAAAAYLETRSRHAA